MQQQGVEQEGARKGQKRGVEQEGAQKGKKRGRPAKDKDDGGGAGVCAVYPGQSGGQQVNRHADPAVRAGTQEGKQQERRIDSVRGR